MQVTKVNIIEQKLLYLERRKMAQATIKYVSDENGKTTGVIVPIKLWKEIISEKETAYLLKTETMKKRLLKAKSRQEGIPFEVAREKLGI